MAGKRGNWDIDDGGLLNFGPEHSPSDEAIKGEPDIEQAPPPPPPAPKRPRSQNESHTVGSHFLKTNYGWAFKADVSPDGKHTVYSLKDASGEHFCARWQSRSEI